MVEMILSKPNSRGVLSRAVRMGSSTGWWDVKKKECISMFIHNISSAGNDWDSSDFVNQTRSGTNEYDKNHVNSTCSAYSHIFFDFLTGWC